VDEAFVLYAAHGAEIAQLDLLRHMLGKEPKISHSAGNTLTVLTIASAGLGLALVPAPLAKVLLPGIEYRPLADVTIMADLGLIYRTGETTGAVKAFLGLAKKALHPLRMKSRSPNIRRSKRPGRSEEC
jgi:DNA-binding transcriptional LysR family regulator